MAGYQPPYSITPHILNRVVDVGELLGRWAAHTEQSSVLLRKENRIRTIQASLAIEHNSLSTQQVTAIMSLNLFIRLLTATAGWDVCGRP